MKLVVGLGNPGKEYNNTRHNIGYMILDNYLSEVNWQSKLDSWLYETEIHNQKVLFIKPTTFMNLSGIAVKKVIDYYKIDISDILIIQDDVDLLLGKYRIKKNSSSGGHNGIKSIINELHSNEFARLKIGIDKSMVIPLDKYVLGKLTKNELEKIKDNYEVFNNIIDDFIAYGIDKTMMMYNNN